ncbi:hypothetical protein [Sphingobacterium spiritivorum]|uniref:hypothetical protein n=1 Tax=Sphingobacterium spiritivorum TaxID=258 RepID=UPI0019194224|nr:hypothetical protein [Sphingobacterium spiritivorum]QQT27811.1 hypothetical protein I6J02_08205 [Sphingobacterium spiritivorum]
MLANKVSYARGLFVFHILLLLNGFISIVFGYNSIGYFMVQFVALLIIPIYYFSFFKYFEFKINEIVRLYCRLVLFLVIIGFIRFPIDLTMNNYWFRSIMLEPAHYAAIVLPAFFITLKSIEYPRYYWKLILLSIILSGSSLAIICLGLCLILSFKRISIIKVMIGASLSFLIGILVYNFYPSFKLRVDDTMNSFITKDLTQANLSSYALLSNLFVALKSFESNPIFGNGIGSHLTSRELYLGGVKGISVFEEMGMDNLNAQDAGSLFIRLLSETGLLGLILFGYFLYHFYVKNDKENILYQNSIISKGILIYFFAKLFREGHYFSPEMYFFVFLYVFNNFQSKVLLRKSNYSEYDSNYINN